MGRIYEILVTDQLRDKEPIGVLIADDQVEASMRAGMRQTFFRALAEAKNAPNKFVESIFVECVELKQHTTNQNLALIEPRPWSLN